MTIIIKVLSLQYELKLHNHSLHPALLRPSYRCLIKTGNFLCFLPPSVTGRFKLIQASTLPACAASPSAFHFGVGEGWRGGLCTVGVFTASNSSREIPSVCSQHAGMQFHAKRVIKVKSATRPACSRGTKCGGSTFEGRLWPKYKETIATQPAPGEELCRLAAPVCSSRGERDGFIPSLAQQRG